MHDSEEIPDDVPVADAVEQQRPVDPVPDEEPAAHPPDDVPLEAAQAGPLVTMGRPSRVCT